jgi:DNA repair protein RecN (Recombination protein N)
VHINDCAATVATLKRLGQTLVDIHGPRANQNILDERFQREALDSFAALDAAPYTAAWRALQALRARREELLAPEAGDGECDLLRSQISELEEAALSEEDEDLADRHAAAAHAGEIVDAATALTEALSGDGGAADILIRLQPTLAGLTKRLPAAAAWADEIDDVTLRLQELSRTVADAASALDADPDTLAALDARLTDLNRLKRKYLSFSDGGAPVPALLALLDRKRARLSDIEQRDAHLAALDAEETAARAALVKAGAALTTKRRAAAERLAKAVTAGLRDLGFLQAKFSVRLDAAEPSPHGCDRVVYLFEPNPGETARPLAASASSGETARVMLALKSVLSAHDATDVLVFDEIDANIGGEVGGVVGAKMKAVAASHQVIAITHLPQSAVYGDRHLVVSKVVSGGRTRTRIRAVDGEARVKEIARMLGGERSTSVVMKHAEEMLQSVRAAAADE